MTLSVISEISTSLDDALLERLSDPLETPAIQIRYGIELAAREILDYLAKTVTTPSGESQVYEFVQRYDGTLFSKLAVAESPLTLLTANKSALAKIQDRERERLIDETRVNSDITPEVAEQVVTIASNVVMESLGQKVRQGASARELAQVLFAQTSHTGDPVVQTTDTCPITPTVSVTVPVASEEEAFQASEEEEEATPTAPTAPVAELDATSLRQSRIPKLDRESPRQPTHVLKAKKTDPVDFSQPPQERTLSRGMQVLVITAAILTMATTGFYAAKIIRDRDVAIQRLLSRAKNEANSPDLVESDFAEADVDLDEGPAAMLTRSVSLRTEPKLGPPSFPRFDITSLPAVVAWAPFQESSQRFAWDVDEVSDIPNDRLRVGPWQVTAQPRNDGRRSCFTFD